MQKYCLGFLFNFNGSEVVLIRKNHPEWQRGLLNGVGGKIRQSELPSEAMSREFHEEAGAYVPDLQWLPVVVMAAPAWKVHVFKTRDQPAFEAANTREAETICKVAVRDIPALNTIPNLSWLIPMCLDIGVRRDPDNIVRCI